MSRQPVTALTPHYFPQLWLLVISFAGFGIFVAWDLGWLGTVYILDRSHIAMLISALVLAASAHACWHVSLNSRRIIEARHHLEQPARERTAPLSDDGYIRHFVDDLARGQADDLLELHADRLRSPVDLGWFLVDLAVRLGLFGTIIGFILIFTSLENTSITADDGLRDLLVAMSGGMGTALFTTLTGLIGGSFLSFQYLILGRQTETLVGLLVRLSHRQVPPPATSPAVAR